MDPRIRRARDEQVRLVALLKSGHPESEGIELAISDWFCEEMMILRELSIRTGVPGFSTEPTLYLRSIV